METGVVDVSVYNATLKEIVHSHPAHQRFLEQQSLNESQRSVDEHERAFAESYENFEGYELGPHDYNPSQSTSQGTPSLSSVEREMDHYMNSTHQPPRSTIDVLKWWKNQEEIMPHLARLVRRIFAITSTSASCERVFSSAGNVCTRRRYNLDPCTVQKLTFIHDNYVQVDLKKWRLTDKERVPPDEEEEREPQDTPTATETPAIAGPSGTSTPLKGTLSAALKNKGQPKK